MNAVPKQLPATHCGAELITQDPRWAAVIARDAAADGTFFYSVRSTGVYCRPSCAARPPRPENVAFHADRAAAERAGFRPCRRCKPERDDGQARDAEAPAAIRFAIGSCALGSILVASSERGLCAILIGDDPAAPELDLQERFPQARRVRDEQALASDLAQVLAFIDVPARGLGLPLDLRGSAFQRRVWQALRAIPSGATASYAGIAARIGAPRAARAVARACAANPLAVAVPCHRVVRSNGNLSGYRWGVERKRALLAREAGT